MTIRTVTTTKVASRAVSDEYVQCLMSKPSARARTEAFGESAGCAACEFRHAQVHIFDALVPLAFGGVELCQRCHQLLHQHQVDLEVFVDQVQRRGFYKVRRTLQRQAEEQELDRVLKPG